ncbi:uncharacterized protein AMSG_04778 [Thecamonas trahens ATCC 50062]|uniref:Uncharacterized protein n=1 Tax=Thecamonas trahens ATCC 50062 TaxID=461836 RepID=A0A0L0D9L8_THETB|nr:hypothetical protein AMSG_04778 [Thecamonas trahens ATCC 50062]KNC49034.1 hypothetical protein AMSG_04778 [Thecamonas trahens ATCC 50062]|eukprot:XP_013758444.1 hypothetical protein AMSG_04778 [Thecamonas trahens ATCC 50062]
MISITINFRTRDLTVSAYRLFADPADADRIANMSSFTVLGFDIRIRGVTVRERLTGLVAKLKDMIVAVYDHVTDAAAELHHDLNMV